MEQITRKDSPEQRPSRGAAVLAALSLVAASLPGSVVRAKETDQTIPQSSAELRDSIKENPQELIRLLEGTLQQPDLQSAFLEDLYPLVKISLKPGTLLRLIELTQNNPYGQNFILEDIRLSQFSAEELAQLVRLTKDNPAGRSILDLHIPPERMLEADLVASESAEERLSAVRRFLSSGVGLKDFPRFFRSFSLLAQDSHDGAAALASAFEGSVQPEELVRVLPELSESPGDQLAFAKKLAEPFSFGNDLIRALDSSFSRALLNYPLQQYLVDRSTPEAKLIGELYLAKLNTLAGKFDTNQPLTTREKRKIEQERRKIFDNFPKNQEIKEPDNLALLQSLCSAIPGARERLEQQASSAARFVLELRRANNRARLFDSVYDSDFIIDSPRLLLEALQALSAKGFEKDLSKYQIEIARRFRFSGPFSAEEEKAIRELLSSKGKENTFALGELEPHFSSR